MKRIISWIVLYLISCVIGILTFLVVGLCAYLLGLINELNTVLRLLVYMIGGSTFISLLFLPVRYGSFLAVVASEAIKESKKGLRYIVFSTYMLISNTIHIIAGINEHTFHIDTIIMCIYYVMLIIVGRETAAQNNNNIFQEDPEPEHMLTENTLLNNDELHTASDNEPGEDKEEKTFIDIDSDTFADVLLAMDETFKPGALAKILGIMEAKTGKADIDEFVTEFIRLYKKEGGIGNLSSYFKDGGKAVIEAIERI